MRCQDHAGCRWSVWKIGFSANHEGPIMPKMESTKFSRRTSAARYVSALACLLLFGLAAFGQGDRGSITGTITDPQGGVAPNASIDARNVDTGEVFHGGTSATGNYVIPVPTGRYELTVTLQGFKK